MVEHQTLIRRSDVQISKRNFDFVSEPRLLPTTTIKLVVVVLYNIFQARDGAISRGLPSSSTSASVAVDRE